MKIVKLKIKNIYGIKEYETNGSSIELSGENGVGKTSVIDAVRYALTNKPNRKYIVRKGETEGEVLIETDNGIRIDRKVRTNQADYKSIKKDGKEVGSPETFLRDIFTPLQLSPVEFMAMDEKSQNAIILDMIEYDWNMNTIRNWFGEIPDWVSYDQNILQILNDIQSEKGYYFQHRQDVNRDIRNKKAFIEDIACTIPDGYMADKWESEDLGNLYQEIERTRKENETIEKAKRFIADRNNKIRKFDAEREISMAALDREFTRRESDLKERIASLEEQLLSAKKELTGLSESKSYKLEAIESKYKADVASYDAAIEEYRAYADLETKPLDGMLDRANYTEKMKKHLNEYYRMVSLQDAVAGLEEESRVLTSKIEKARNLPGEILQNAIIPIKGLSVENGIPLINGLPITNLSDGEKLDLCIDVAIQKPNGLQIILIDGVESLSTKLREQLYAKCKNKGLQFIATRTTDDPDLTVVEL